MLNKFCLGLLNALVLVTIFASCHKNNSSPSAPVVPPPNDSTPVVPLGTLNINLHYPYPTDSFSTTYELVINETAGGKVLLDTIAAVNTTVKAALATNAKIFDVSTIYYSRSGSIVVTSYKSVNPSTWGSSVAGSYTVPYGTPTTPGSAYYTNYPASVTTPPDFSSYGNFIGNSRFFIPGEHAFEYDYYYQPGNLIYLYIPANGTYNLHQAIGANDTVDLSTMDTVKGMNFVLTPNYYTVFASLVGIFDTTNFGRSVSFFDPTFPPPQGNIVYPPTVPVQKYELSVGAGNGPINADFYSYSSSIPTNIIFPTTANYAVSNNTADNFTVSFNGIHPSYYVCRGGNTSGSVYYRLYSSPDSSTVHPMSFLKALHAKMLSDQDLSSVQTVVIGFETVDNDDFATWLALTCNPSTLLTHRVTTATSFYNNL
jgi:hypothetical protein